MNEQHQMEQREYWKASAEFVRSEVNNVITKSSFSGVMRKEIRMQPIKRKRRWKSLENEYQLILKRLHIAKLSINTNFAYSNMN